MSYSKRMTARCALRSHTGLGSGLPPGLITKKKRKKKEKKEKEKGKRLPLGSEFTCNAFQIVRATG